MIVPSQSTLLLFLLLHLLAHPITCIQERHRHHAIPLKDLAAVQASMGLPPPTGYHPKKIKTTKPNSFLHVPQRLHHKYAKLGHALEHSSELMRFRSGAASKAGTSVEVQDTYTSKSSTLNSKDDEDAIPIECPSDAFGRPCSDRGDCDTKTGECTCSKKIMERIAKENEKERKKAAGVKTSMFGFVQTMEQVHAKATVKDKAWKGFMDSIKGALGMGVGGGEPYGPGCQFFTCPKVDNEICNGQGSCNPSLGECQCFPGWTGEDCATDPNSLNEFDVECEDMGDQYIAECIRATTTGACKAYQLTWDRMCYKTCVANTGRTCILQTRRDFCSHSPDCEVLCNSMMDISCNRYITIAPGTEFDKIDNDGINGTKESSSPGPSGSEFNDAPGPSQDDGKPYALKKTGQAIHDKKHGRGNKAGYIQKKSGTKNKSGMYIKTEKEDGTKKKSKGGMSGGHPLVGHPTAVSDVDTTLTGHREEQPSSPVVKQGSEGGTGSKRSTESKGSKGSTESKGSKGSKGGLFSAMDKEDRKRDESPSSSSSGKGGKQFRFQETGLPLQEGVALLELAAEERRSRSSIDRRRKGSSFVGQHQVANGLLSHGSPNDMARALKHLRERSVVIRKQMSKTYGFDVSQYARPTKGEEKQAKLPSDYNDAFTSLERNQQFYSHRSGGLGRRNV